MRCGALALLVVMGGCGGDSSGDSGGGTETAGTSGGPSTTTMSSTSGSPSTSNGTSSSTASTGPTTTTDPTGSSDSTETSGNNCPEHPNFNCTSMVNCESERCGELDSHFGDDGCMRALCDLHEECEKGELCYQAQQYDGCLSGGWDCNDDDNGACVCGGDPDCSGAVCVPAELHPLGEVPGMGPQETGYGANDCAPDDSPALRFEIGVEASACDSPPNGSPVVTFLLYDTPMMPTWHPLGVATGIASYDSDGDGTAETTGQLGVFRVTDWIAEGVSGHYDVRFDDGTVLGGTFGPLPFCGTPVICG